MSILDEITAHFQPPSQYIDEVTKKNQIFLHHTASDPNPYGVIEYWNSSTERVGTAFLIGGPSQSPTAKWHDGGIVQCFSSKKWAWHLGLKASDLVKGGRGSTGMNSMAVGIEICNWGYLTQKNGGLITYANTHIPDKWVIELDKPYRGYTFWNRYSEAQLESARKLLLYLCDTYGIDRKYKGIQMFDINHNCLMGENGIWTHTSVRKDKWDCFPQPEFIQMLESL